ncbi:MAG: inositol monophosphatase [Nocardioidaceae bacterium]|nr:inositol monophosphatase [Nocardioidaceae bacterium]
MSLNLALMRLAAAVSAEAGSLVAKSRSQPLEVAATKSSRTDVVTAVDVASEQLIRRRLLTARPHDGIHGEEGDDVVGTSGVEWVVDPIDGTVNFLYGIAQFAVCIAARVDGEVAAAAVHNPVTGEMFSAVRGGGAARDGDPISVSDCAEPAMALVGTGFSYSARVRQHQAAELARLVPRVRDIRRMGSAALDLCAVACGRLDAYVERGLKPWDLAAAGLVAEEAGARVEGLNGAPAGELLVVAAGRGLFGPLHELLVDSGFDDWPLKQWPSSGAEA